jgi:uncharacterized phage protein (TIGR01671 family)
MREIKFRGIRVDNGEWVIGFLTGSPHEDTCYILPQYDWETKYEVEPKSVGQYTGLKDKNGVEIHEGDIVRIHNFKTTFKNGDPTIDFRVFAIERNQYTYAFNNSIIYMPLSGYDINSGDMYEIEKLGNIYDNKELIEDNDK